MAAENKRTNKVVGVVWGKYPSMEDPSFNLVIEHGGKALESEVDRAYQPDGYGFGYHETNNIIYNNFSLSLILWGTRENSRVKRSDTSFNKKILYAVYDIGDQESLDFAIKFIEEQTNPILQITETEKNLRLAVLVGYAPPGVTRNTPEVIEREANAKAAANELNIPYAEVNAISHFKSKGLDDAIVAGVDRYFEIYPEEMPNLQVESQTISNWNLFGFLSNPYMVRATAPTAIGIPVGAITWAVLSSLGKNVTPFDTVGHSIGIGAGAGLAIGLMLIAIKCGQGVCKDDHPYQPVSQKVN